MNYGLPLLFILLAGCSTTAKSQEQASKLNMVNIVDQSKEMRPLSNLIIGGGDAFIGVDTHSINYSFECAQETYKLRFFVNSGEDKLSVELSEFFKGTSTLKAKMIKSINTALTGAETIGPVGLRCSLKEIDPDLSLVMRIAFIDKTTDIYQFQNKKFIISPQDFE